MFLAEIKKTTYVTEQMSEGWSVAGAKIDYEHDTLCQKCEKGNQLFVYILTNETGESINACKECAENYTGQNLRVHHLDQTMNERFNNRDEHSFHMEWKYNRNRNNSTRESHISRSKYSRYILSETTNGDWTLEFHEKVYSIIAKSLPMEWKITAINRVFRTKKEASVYAFDHKTDKMIESTLERLKSNKPIY